MKHPSTCRGQYRLVKFGSTTSHDCGIHHTPTFINYESHKYQSFDASFRAIQRVDGHRRRRDRVTASRRVLRRLHALKDDVRMRLRTAQHRVSKHAARLATEEPYRRATHQYR